MTCEAMACIAPCRAKNQRGASEGCDSTGRADDQTISPGLPKSVVASGYGTGVPNQIYGFICISLLEPGVVHKGIHLFHDEPCLLLAFPRPLTGIPHDGAVNAGYAAKTSSVNERTVRSVSSDVTSNNVDRSVWARMD